MIRPRKVTCVVGARPNFVKMAPVLHALRRRSVRARLVHTGQHADERMSGVFFNDLDLPPPDACLRVGRGSHAVQTAHVMERFDADCTRFEPDLVVVAGDVNSSLACALVAAKRGIAVAHIEAGLRSGDRRMAEEVNRILIDDVSDLLFTPSVDADDNLRREGVAEWRIHRVGNLMIDSLHGHLSAARARQEAARLRLKPQGYAVVTLHRPSNVDDARQLAGLLVAVGEVAERLPVVFPIHPRTRQRIADGRLSVSPDVRLIEPLGYLAFLGLMASARFMITDSGGIQEETTVLGLPCLTVRDTTERPITVTDGTNTLLGSDPTRIAPAVDALLTGGATTAEAPPLWDGRSAARVADVICGGFRTLLEM